MLGKQFHALESGISLKAYSKEIEQLATVVLLLNRGVMAWLTVNKGVLKKKQVRLCIMENMSILVIIFVSIPEYILDLYIGLMAVGERPSLFLNKLNTTRFILAMAGLGITNYYVRAFSPNLTIMLVGLMICYTIIIKAIYNFKWIKSLLTVTAFYSVLLFLELLYIPQTSALILGTFDKVLKSDSLRIALSAPERIFQFVIALCMWRANVVLLNINKFEKFKKQCSLVIYPLFIAEWILAVTLAYSTSTMTTVLLSSVLGILAIVNFGLFRLITAFTKVVRLEELKNQEKLGTIDIVNILLKRNNKDVAAKIAKKAVNQ